MTEACVREIVELHEFFQGWLGGGLAATEGRPRRPALALAEDFLLISPDGRTRNREEVLSWIAGAHGRHGPTFRIRIRNVACRLQEGGLCLATYEEWQEREGEADGRLSTVLFRGSRDAPNGLEWVHVHETRLSEGR